MAVEVDKHRASAGCPYDCRSESARQGRICATEIPTVEAAGGVRPLASDRRPHVLRGEPRKFDAADSLIARGELEPTEPNPRDSRGERALEWHEAIERARGTNSFSGPAQALAERLRLYYVARAHEGLANTASAVDAYRRLLEHEWPETASRVRLIADAPGRLRALRGVEPGR